MDNKEVFEPLLRDGDNYDLIGNKGYFHLQEGWMVSVVTTAPFETAAAAAKASLPLDHFIVIKVENWDYFITSCLNID